MGFFQRKELLSSLSFSFKDKAYRKLFKIKKKVVGSYYKRRYNSKKVPFVLWKTALVHWQVLLGFKKTKGWSLFLLRRPQPTQCTQFLNCYCNYMVCILLRSKVSFLCNIACKLSSFKISENLLIKAKVWHAPTYSLKHRTLLFHLFKSLK